jgi:hypothetical protein
MGAGVPETPVPAEIDPAAIRAAREHTTHSRSAPAAQPSVAVSSAVSPSSESPSAVPSPSPVATVTPDEAKSLLKEFQQAQNTEIKALEHRQKLELKELKAVHAARFKEWNTKEKDARHKFFAENRGRARRDYIVDFTGRRATFLKMLSEELTSRVNENEVRLKSVKQDQADRLKDFQAALSKGERPEQRLWP